jgi:hypothetical protein
MPDEQEMAKADVTDADDQGVGDLPDDTLKCSAGTGRRG